MNIEQKGIKMALLTALISGFAVFINKFAITNWASSSVFATSRNIITAIFLIAFLVSLKKFAELKNISRANWIKLALIGLIGGSIAFLMFFKALTLMSSTEAALIHKTLFLWVALFSYPFLKERLNLWQFAGLALFASAIFMPGITGTWTFGSGFWLALGATILWSAENIIAKITLKEVSPTVVAWARMFFGSMFLAVFVIATGEARALVPSSLAQAGWMIFSGAILFGYVTTWYYALKHSPATVVSSILVIAAPITVFLNSIFVTHTFPTRTIVPAIIMVLGILFISKQFEHLYSKYIKRRESAYS
ncbi:MAG: hypothetical protein COU46_00645 [Candidatus Niyogibacteria bacterium CG10_big_fil_rev_8_21_14_0_10_42_19]|uniref:EamA domain-containing protein n=1 Tax=Candidatus Niyogibacteria bacterium CG10_big_fil_rev_8_21_14_0_10_42_19 TaxID=1974725 RepID=A0A2H0TGC2_9BACT|nr:MAG: hypothetical protein COU46_00645 [Candidatus Niyogibacteria bacterium CG10_big_fil_rev_8_21_14_0_10_42_19]